MKIVSAKKLSEALSKAQGVGIVEERFTIGDCEVVLRNLRPDEHEAIVTEAREFDDVAFLNAYQRAHVCRAMVEINGTDLRDVRFIEDDDPKKPGGTIRIELHTWINNTILSTWSKEAIFVAYRKVGDVIAQAEDKAKDGIQFRLPEETPEEKLRRLVGELKELEEEIPVELVTRIMGEVGYLRKTTMQEAEAVDQRLGRLAAEQAAQQEAQVEPEPHTHPEESEPVQAAPTPQELMARRAPMNRVPTQDNTPVQAPAIMRAPPPQAVDLSSTNTTPTPASRSAQIAALEGDITDEAIAAAGPPMRPQVMHQEVAELSHRAAPIDPKAVRGILDTPPVGGINPRFQRPPRG